MKNIAHPEGTHLMPFLILIFLSTLNIPPLHAQETVSPKINEDQVASITRIVRHVTKGIVGPNQETLTPEQETLITQISQQLIQEANVVQAEQNQINHTRQENKNLVKTIVLNVSKGIAIIVALLVLRAIIKAIGRGTKLESPNTPIGVMITTSTTEQALALGKQIIDQNWATGGSVTPTLQSLYRKDDKAYVTPEAMLMLKTTNQHLPNIITQTETADIGAPEIIALSRSIIP
jgi:uncharacterized protein involved in tolerance to divalent cations